MPKVMWDPMDKLVPQLLGVIIFSYNLCFRCMIAHWKGLSENYTICHQTLTLSIVWLWRAKKTLFRAPKRPWKYNKMCWHENIQNKRVGLGERPPISTWKMCRVSDNPISVEPIITKKYRITCWANNRQEEPVGIGGWPPISAWINPPPLGSNGLHCVDFPHQVRKILLYLAPSEPLSFL